MTIRNPLTGEDVYLVDENNEVQDLLTDGEEEELSEDEPC